MANICTNVLTATIFSNSPGLHAMVISNTTTNGIGFDVLLCPSLRTATNIVLCPGPYDTPYAGSTFSGQTTNLALYNAALSNMVTSLNSVGLAAKYVDSASTFWSAGTNFMNSDLLHPNFQGQLCLTGNIDCALTGGWAHFLNYLNSGRVLNPYGAPGPANWNTTCAPIAGNGNGVTNTTSSFGNLVVVASTSTWTNFNSSGVSTLTNSSLTGTFAKTIAPGASIVSGQGNISSCRITFGD
jgi:hypothetical protein